MPQNAGTWRPWAGMSWLLVIVALALQAGCGTKHAERAGTADAGPAPADGPQAPQRVTLQLNWFPEAEHGGYYAALVHGYYGEAGLDVKILPGGTDAPVLQLVAGRAATFGVINADNVLFGRAQQVPAVALMAPIQTSPRCLIVHQSAGIRGFEDLKDMTLAMSPGSAFSQFLRHKLPLAGVQVVAYSGNVAQFLLDKSYAQQGYVFSEPFVARKQGGDPQVLMVSDLGFNPYTSLLFTHEARVRDEPDLVRRMVAASIRGWAKYIESPEKANESIHRVNPQMDLDILAYGAETLKPLVLDAASEARGIGTMSHQRWLALLEQLVESGQLKPGAVDVDKAYTLQFLKQP